MAALLQGGDRLALARDRKFLAVQEDFGFLKQLFQGGPIHARVVAYIAFCCKKVTRAASVGRFRSLANNRHTVGTIGMKVASAILRGLKLGV